MATLYNRATPSQRKVLRMIEGAVLNVAHHHPHYRLDEQIARSIAKRATGTLTAQWPDVLAAVSSPPSDHGTAILASRRSSRMSLRVCSGTVSGERHRCNRRSPLRELRKQLGLMAGWARKAGHLERASALADALRVLARIEAER